MALSEDSNQLSKALLEFSRTGQFPDDISTIPPVSSIDLEPTIAALDEAKEKLEIEIHNIVEETKDDVSSWVNKTKILQEDIIRSKTIANDLERDFEAPDISGEAIEDAQAKVEFLNREFQYSSQLQGVLTRIQRAQGLLAEAGTACNGNHILDSLRLLEQFWAAVDDIGVSDTSRVVKALNARAFELKSRVRQVFDGAWKQMLQIDMDAGLARVEDAIPEFQMDLEKAVIGLKAFKETDERLEQLWHNIDAAIVGPRMDRSREQSPSLTVDNNSVRLQGQADNTIQSLLFDLEALLTVFGKTLPNELLEPLSRFMMPDLVPRLTQHWLNPSVPSSLANMGGFKDTIQGTDSFCQALRNLGYCHFDDLRKWVDNAPTVWLNKCRETNLDAIRINLGSGIGKSRPVEKVEKQMVSLAEGHELATSGAGAVADTNDWGDEWAEDWDEQGAEKASNPQSPTAVSKVDDGDDGVDAWGDAWGVEDDNDETTTHEKDDTKQGDEKDDADEDDSAAAWGWDDEDHPVVEDAPKLESDSPAKKKRIGPSTQQQATTRELILRETYHISSMPDPVLELIYSILEDGATLTKDEPQYSHIANTAAGLFSLPTFVLALFRAVAPGSYPVDESGSMFLYNDAIHLADSLAQFSEQWKQRDDLTERAKKYLRLDTEITSLRRFANRSYANAMNLQKTVLRDFLGGGQSIMQHDEATAAIESGTARIRSVAKTWEPILARSVWSQAIGSLAETLATKIITDVLDMSNIGQEEAYSIAKLISHATELDDLFLPSRLAGAEPTGGDDDIPATAQYAPSWLRLKFLSEVLQSNLNEVKYLWLESELSLHFTAREVVDLIEASFESNPRTREAMREIQARPEPMSG